MKAKHFKRLLDEFNNKTTDSVKLSWEGMNHVNGPYPVIEIVKKDDSYAPLQLCPKCGGQGTVSNFDWDVKVWSYNTACVVCDGNKVIPMIKT